jgi:hypothetical protein
MISRLAPDRAAAAAISADNFQDAGFALCSFGRNVPGMLARRRFRPTSRDPLTRLSRSAGSPASPPKGRGEGGEGVVEYLTHLHQVFHFKISSAFYLGSLADAVLPKVAEWGHASHCCTEPRGSDKNRNGTVLFFNDITAFNVFNYLILNNITALWLRYA